MKKLSLNKITVAKLSDKQLSHVQGGTEINCNGGGTEQSFPGGPICVGIRVVDFLAYNNQ